MSIKSYKREAREILKDLCVYDKLTDEEREAFRNATTEIQVDNLLVSFRRKYL